MANHLQPREIILSLCEPEEFSGREAHSTLNRISKAMHEAVLNRCSYFEKSKAVSIFYNLFDEACCHIFEGKHFQSYDLPYIIKMEKAPTIFRYLLEATILSSEIQRDELTEKEIHFLVNGASIFLEACVYSNYLFRNDFKGGFAVSKSGDITFQDNALVRKSEEDFLGKIGLISEKMVSGADKLELLTNPKRASLKGDALPYDPLFKETYGVKLSTIVGCAESIVFDVCKKKFGVVSISQNELLKRVRRKTLYGKQDIKKALRFLEIDKGMLSTGYQYYRFYDAPISVSKRPIIRLFSGSGQKGDVVYLGRNVLARAILLLFADIDMGIIKLGDVAERWKEEKGPEFEEHVRSMLFDKGFRVLRVTDSPPDVGEIDAVAFHEKKGVLLIVEAKAPRIDLSMEKAKLHFERSRKWCQKHDNKVRWAKENAQMLIKRLNLPETQVKEVLGIIVTRVPWYVEPDLPYLIVSIDEFDRMLDRFSSPR